MAHRSINRVNIDQYTQAPLQMTKTLELSADPEAVFATLADFTAMPSWFPGMTAVAVDNTSAELDGGAGAVRVCSFGPAQTMNEDILILDPPKTLAYAIREGNFMGLSQHFALVCVEPWGDGSLLSWHQFFHHPDPEAFNAQGGAMLDGALDNLRTKHASR